MTTTNYDELIEGVLAAMSFAQFFEATARAFELRGYPSVAEHCRRIARQFEIGSLKPRKPRTEKPK